MKNVPGTPLKLPANPAKVETVGIEPTQRSRHELGSTEPVATLDCGEPYCPVIELQAGAREVICSCGRSISTGTRAPANDLTGWVSFS